jgi:hypothetical protein
MVALALPPLSLYFGLRMQEEFCIDISWRVPSLGPARNLHKDDPTVLFTNRYKFLVHCKFIKITV